MKLARALAPGLILMLAATMSADAGTLRVGSVTDLRFQSSWTLDGSHMTAARAKLRNPANFGPNGIVPDSIAITDTAPVPGTINLAALSNYDVFFIGYIDDASGRMFTPDELASFQSWVYGGGTIIVTCEDAQHDAVCAYFGHPVLGRAATSPSIPDPARATHPVWSGPFGAVTAVEMFDDKGAFTLTAGATVLGTESSPSRLPSILVHPFGNGKIVFLSDVDMLSDATLSKGASINYPNDRFLGNLFAFAGSITPRVGLWWNPSEPGTGYNIDVRHNTLVVTTYSYKSNGDSEWYISTGPLVANSFTGVLDKARGGQCIDCAYSKALPGGSDGTISIRFTSPVAATLVLPGGRTLPIQPQEF